MIKIVSSFILLLIKLYQMIISPILPSSCRYIPTCSEYMKQAVVKHGCFKGLILGFKRIFKCHPWGKSGEDFVP